MDKNILKQDLSQEQSMGAPFGIHLFFAEKSPLPDQAKMEESFKKHGLRVGFIKYQADMVMLEAKDYQVEYDNGKAPAQLLIMGADPMDNYQISDLVRSQMWEVTDSEEILEKTKYHIFATDFMARGLDYDQRATLDMDFLEALVDMFPTCLAVQFQESGKMFHRDQVANHQIPKAERFIHFAVNVRFFNIEGSQDMLVDSLGMGTLMMPDVQYHFHDMDPNWVVNHAYNLLVYMYKNANPFQTGDTIDGVVDGNLAPQVQWPCNYEQALIQPAREVLDVYMDQYAAGKR